MICSFCFKALDFGKKKKKKKIKEDLFKDADEVAKAAEAVEPVVDYHKASSSEPKAEGEAEETEELDFGKKKPKKNKVKFDPDQNTEIEVFKSQ